MLFPVAMLIVAPVAALSWYALEKPALALKRRQPRQPSIALPAS